MTQSGSVAACSFDGCSTSIIERVVMAAVDQLCAHADISVELLDALEFPLGEALGAVAEFGVVRVGIEVDAGRLAVTIELRTMSHDPSAVLGDAAGVVSSFFEVRPLTGSTGLSLSGELG